jgi:2-polyprenyl-3-methyl-5-hydroxy-6-metoxy-1,4-benzoquinol methylase
MLCKWCGDSTSLLDPFSEMEGRFDAPKKLLFEAGFKRYQCNSCSSIFYNRIPSAKLLNDLYSEMARSTMGKRKAFGTSDTKICQQLLNAAKFKPTTNSCLEFGPGRGSMAKLLTSKGVYVDVVEPYSETNFADFGVTNYHRLDSIPLNRKYDWIFLIEVIEHVTEPILLLEQLKTYLNQNGKLFITTPNAAGVVARYYKSDWRELKNPTHLNLFSPKALKSALLKAGFNKIKRVRMPVKFKNGSIERVLHSFLQILGFDGGIRILAN